MVQTVTGGILLVLRVLTVSDWLPWTGNMDGLTGTVDYWYRQMSDTVVDQYQLYVVVPTAVGRVQTCTCRTLLIITVHIRVGLPSPQA